MSTKPDVTTKLAYSVREAVRATSLARSTIYNHIASGRLKAVRIGGRVSVRARGVISGVD